MSHFIISGNKGIKLCKMINCIDNKKKPFVKRKKSVIVLKYVCTSENLSNCFNILHKFNEL